MNNPIRPPVFEIPDSSQDNTRRILDQDHAKLDAVLAEVFSALDEGRLDRAYEFLDIFWGHLAVHIRAENIELFPALLRASERALRHADAPSHDKIVDTVAQLRVDHDFLMSELAGTMKKFRVLRQAGQPVISAELAGVRERLARVSNRLATHNVIEETQAYRWVTALFDQVEQASLADHIQRELGNLPARLRSQPPLLPDR
jgi:hypothetical protein